jgi:hypothetical protein
MVVKWNWYSSLLSDHQLVLIEEFRGLLKLRKDIL